jgi:hypothetical protein
LLLEQNQPQIEGLGGVVLDAELVGGRSSEEASETASEAEQPQQPLQRLLIIELPSEVVAAHVVTPGFKDKS